MKAIKILTLAALTGLTMSCKEDTLNITPLARNTASDFYKDETQINQAVIAIYNSGLSLPTNSLWNMSEIRSDNTLETQVNVQRDWNDIGNFLMTSQTGQIQATWTDLYEIVYRSNILLEKVAPFKFQRVPQFQAEAKFWRALAYFDLVRFWGDVPLSETVVSIEEAKLIPRSPAKEVYNLIVSDLQFAAQNLPETYATADKGRATKWAAKALLGRVYLTMAGFPLKQADKLALAKKELADVIAQEGKAFTFAPTYKALFQTANDNKYHVFEIQYISGGFGIGSQAPSDMAFQFPSQWSAFQPIGPDGQVDLELYSSWPAIDQRKAATLDSGYVDTKTNARSGRMQYTKFLEKGATSQQNRSDYSLNFPLIRYEDVLLMYAEILNEEVAEGAAPPTEAVTILNRIRKRAGVPDVKPATKAGFRLAMEQERRWEFAAEGLRWHDIVRTGRAIELMTKFTTANAIKLSKPLNENDLLFPIPQNEMLINPGFWKQNPGYN
ncbi:RagB/SusD family nutrient uptake outer membrane protein [Tellurirhabdus rosea]|uniref:RagB/SusD family nutrient uptake outer membrane protein n=1 Tax=Tellurirhabdus rosea TaxID=2674997 RepID=UPI002250421B|nr:RagB/SusD family nutrient uptake outer membrane protein [Tellurirhabdus rosea]